MKSGFFLFFFFTIFLLGCSLRPSVYAPQGSFDLRYLQFGSQIFVKDIRGEPLRFEGAKKVEKVSEGWLVEPEGDCLKVSWKEGSKRLCLKSVPLVYPHLKVLRMDSYALDLKILSLFPKIGLFIWEKGQKPDFLNPRFLSPGVHSLRELSLGKTYLLSAAVYLAPDLYGPLSRPLVIEMKDETPPLPPPGGGYFLKGNTVVLIWDPSPSRDVVGYIVEREGKVFRVKQTMFQDEVELFKKPILYNIKALDGAGQKSLPLSIKVFFGEVKDERKKGEK